MKKFIIMISVLLSMLFLSVCAFAQEDEEPAVPPSAQIVCISKATEKANVQVEGDVVGIFPGDHQFSATEKAKFDIIQVPGMSPGQVREELLKNVSDPENEEIKKFATSLKTLTVADKAALSDEKASVEAKCSIFSTKTTDNSIKAVEVGEIGP